MMAAEKSSTTKPMVKQTVDAFYDSISQTSRKMLWKYRYPESNKEIFIHCARRMMGYEGETDDLWDFVGYADDPSTSDKFDQIIDLLVWQIFSCCFSYCVYWFCCSRKKKKKNHP
eukprot:458683_1